MPLPAQQKSPLSPLYRFDNGPDQDATTKSPFDVMTIAQPHTLNTHNAVPGGRLPVVLEQIVFHYYNSVSARCQPEFDGKKQCDLIFPLTVRVQKVYSSAMSTHTQAPRYSRVVSRSPIYYVWIVWAIATLGLVTTSPGQSFNVSLFIDHYIADFGLNRTTVSTLYGVGTFLAALTLTWVGRQIDRHGNRRMGVIISALFTVAVAGMSFVAGPAALLIGFIAIRGLGQGSLSLVNSTVIVQWFQRRRGMMMSLAILVWALLQRVYVPQVQALIETYGWRQVWLMLAAFVGLTILPLTWLFVRDRPEDYGLQPDGDRQPTAETAVTPERNWTLKEAMHTAIFWIFLMGRWIAPTWGTGLIFHQISLFGALGHSASTAAATYGTYAIVTAVASLAFGLLIDRFRPQLIIALQLAFVTAAMFIAMRMTSSALLIAYAASLGLSAGSGGVFDGAVWVNLFGRQHQGSIRGFVATSQIIGSALGPILFGFSYDNLGGYAPVLWLGIAVAAVPLILSIFARQPEKSTAPVAM